jgi:hypothetical protein
VRRPGIGHLQTQEALFRYWDSEDVLAIAAGVGHGRPAGKKQLLIAGFVTEVCVAFPALFSAAPPQRRFFRFAL